MRKKLVILFIFVMLFTTGCTKSFMDEDSNKRYTSNILCQPETKEVEEIYNNKENKLDINLEKLPQCEKFKPTSGGYEGLWTSLFVKPLAYLIIKLGMIVKYYGISIMILGVLLRVIMIPLTNKSTSMSNNLNSAKPELDRLEKKYANKTDQASMNAKAAEMMAIYKKYKINPLSGCIFAFLQIPLFFAFLEAIQRIPVIYEEKLWIFQMGTTPSEALKAGQYWYLILVVLIILATYYSFKNMNMSMTDDAQAKQMKTMNTFMVVFIGFASFTLPAAIAFYWIVSNGFTIIQNLFKKKQLEPKKIKEVKVVKTKNKKK